MDRAWFWTVGRVYQDSRFLTWMNKSVVVPVNRVGRIRRETDSFLW